MAEPAWKTFHGEERLLTSWEAEEKASREAEARKAAEEEVTRLRAEIDRLKRSPK